MVFGKLDSSAGSFALIGIVKSFCLCPHPLDSFSFMRVAIAVSYRSVWTCGGRVKRLQQTGELFLVLCWFFFFFFVESPLRWEKEIIWWTSEIEGPRRSDKSTGEIRGGLRQGCLRVGLVSDAALCLTSRGSPFLYFFPLALLLIWYGRADDGGK